MPQMLQIKIVEMHNEVLLPWAEYRLKQQTESLPVIVLDHHTDVMPAFRDPLCRINSGTWKDLDQVRCAVKKLRHDEHFHWALCAGLISGCTISACVNGTVPADPRLKICWDERWQDENAVFAAPEKFRFLADSVLETEYLAARFGEMEALPEKFILDIDCDYFATEKALHPEDRSYIEGLVRKAVLITVSLEKDWVRLLRFPGETFSAQDIIRYLFPQIAYSTFHSES